MVLLTPDRTWGNMYLMVVTPRKGRNGSATDPLPVDENPKTISMQPPQEILEERVAAEAPHEREGPVDYEDLAILAAVFEDSITDCPDEKGTAKTGVSSPSLSPQKSAEGAGEEAPRHGGALRKGGIPMDNQHLPQPHPPPQEYWDAKRWIEAHPTEVGEHANEWIAVLDGKVIASGNARSVRDAIRRNYRGRHPYVSLVERSPGVYAHRD